MCTSRELLIFRHGKSDWGGDAVNDFDRPLAGRGRKAVKCMASWLRDQSLLPEHILSSTAERARQTALRLCRYADIPETRVEWQDAIYAADLEALLDVLVNAPQQQGRMMIIGHNPGLEELVEYLAGEPIKAPAGSPALPTAGLARLSMPYEWKRLESGCAQVLSINRPRELFE
ncbi:MAG: histidine phosphatase family protein [Gammaproteobacteria bacterium]|nr:histidine phosphatase family protein [Gammaproteobacteria bacterium]